MALQVQHLSKSFGEHQLFYELGFTVNANEKVAIIGATGIGKTTLMRCIMRELEPDNQKAVIQFAEQAKVAYFAQDHSDEFDSDETLFEYLYKYKKLSDDEQVIRGALGRMLFTGDDGKKSLRVLSGGEKARLLFARFSLEKPNILLLDEPTNHLDMESIEALNRSLEQYPGTVIFVSHDREFVSSVATRIIEISAHGIKDYHGTYESYLETQEQ